MFGNESFIWQKLHSQHQYCLLQYFGGCVRRRNRQRLHRSLVNGGETLAVFSSQPNSHQERCDRLIFSTTSHLCLCLPHVLWSKVWALHYGYALFYAFHFSTFTSCVFFLLTLECFVCPPKTLAVSSFLQELVAISFLQVSPGESVLRGLSCTTSSTLLFLNISPFSPR